MSGHVDDGTGDDCDRQWPLPRSHLYVLTHKPGAGRSVTARTHIPAGTTVLTTSPSLSPVAHTLFRPYRREVCAWCFAYDRGRSLPVRSLLAAAGVIFCSQSCSEAWLESVAPDGSEAYEELEKRERRVNRSKPAESSSADVESHDATTASAPSAEDVADMINTFHVYGENAKRVRDHLAPVRDKKETVKSMSADRSHLDPDNLRLLLSGALYARDWNHYRNPARDEPSAREPINVVSVTEDELNQSIPSALLALEGDENVYKTREALTENLASYVELVARLPISLLPSLTPLLCHEIVSRAAHNAFSIRPTGVSDGEQSGEYFGWGIWPEASFFNHSCAPNVSKLRRGRLWQFTTAVDVAPGDDLCITYLGGDENDLAVADRRARLSEHWGFECGCQRCASEAAPISRG